jgi:hypothetical protein
MRHRILIQLAVFDKKGKYWEDAVNLIDVVKDPYRKLTNDVLKNILTYDFHVHKIHRLADGTPHLVEFEAIKDNQ